MTDPPAGDVSHKEFQIRPMTEKDWEDVARIYDEGIRLGTATFQEECPSYQEWDEEHLMDCRLLGKTML